MIIAVVAKGAGILVLPVVLLPLFACIVGTHLFFPEQPPGEQMWLPGASLLISAVILFLLNRHLKQGPQPPPRPTVSGEYAKLTRKATTDAENSRVRSTGRFSADNDTGWFMFIPTRIWPFIIGAMGVFLIVGNVGESATHRVNPDIARPAK